MSYGDRIILAASNIRDWDTNDGNTAVYGQDSVRNNHCFAHTRIYEVTPGTHTYYAVGHNYADTDGTGIASIYGDLAVEFIPTENADIRLSGGGMSLSSFSWFEETYIFRQDTIEAPVKGKLLVDWDGTIYQANNDTVLLTTNLSVNWPVHPEIEPIIMSDQHYRSEFVHRKVYEVEAGTYEVYALGRRFAFDSQSSNNGMYGTLAVQFIPDGVPEAVIVSEIVEETTLIAGDRVSLGELDIQAAEAGKVWIRFTGRLELSPDNYVTLSMVHKGSPDTVLHDQFVQSIIDENPRIYFSNSGYVEVEAGTHQFEVIADFDVASPGSGDATVRGLLTAQYFGPPPVTAVEDDTKPVNTAVFYPNPTPGWLYCKQEDDFVLEDYRIMISDALGRVVLQEQGSALSAFSADLSGLPAGMYTIKLQQGVNTEVQRVGRL